MVLGSRHIDQWVPVGQNMESSQRLNQGSGVRDHLIKGKGNLQTATIQKQSQEGSESQKAKRTGSREAYHSRPLGKTAGCPAARCHGCIKIKRQLSATNSEDLIVASWFINPGRGCQAGLAN